MEEKEPEKEGTALKEKVRNRFLGNGSKGTAGNLRSLGVLGLILVAWIAVIQFVAAEKYDVTVTVTGEAAETDQKAEAEGLDFGSLSKGGSSVRYVTVKNGGKSDIYVKIYKLGGVAGLVKANRDGFTLKAGKSENLEFTVDVPENAQEKEYTGRIIIFQMPKLF